MLRTAVTIGTQESLPQALVVFRGIEESIASIAELGYDGLEIAVFRKENVNPARLKALLARHGLQAPVFSTGQISRVLNLHFSDPDPAVRAEAVRVFRGIIELAGEFGAGINVSLVRGRIGQGASAGEALKRVTGCLEELCRYAATFGCSLLLEQMNRYETDYLNSAAEVGEYIRSAGIPNLEIHADTFHMNIEDRDMCGTLREYSAELGYVHLADSNRLALGQGHIDFSAIMRTLREIGYAGWLGLEVLRVPDSYGAARQSIDHLRNLRP